jgi:transglutaminase-like putative cysteine protease
VVWSEGPSSARSTVVVPQRQPTVGRVDYDVSHSTVYRYGSPVEVSQHLLRLRPLSDRFQQLLDFQLTISPEGFLREFEDVFGNQAHRLNLDTAFDELRIECHSRVRVDTPARDMRQTRRRSTLPVPWMPWQREVLVPFLLPPELPAPQLRELFDFAMSFAERQDYDLIETLEDVNRTIFRDWAYEPGATTLETTPWDVYVSRRGVCQDFANLLICMARLLGIPARYRVGYVDTSRGDALSHLPDASHAWVELYLPRIGWRGFDPTNGSLVGNEHVRVACGRNYRDATPTSGTIYRGGGTETLDIHVSVRASPV